MKKWRRHVICREDEVEWKVKMKRWKMKMEGAVFFPLTYHFLSDASYQKMAGNSGSGSQFNLSQEEMDRLISEVTRHILFKTHQNSGCPIKREELTHLITKSYNQYLLPSYVIEKAGERLSKTFGYEMKELHRNSSSINCATDLKSYVISSRLPADIYRRYVEDLNSTHVTGFTFALVSIVHLCGGKISQENLWHYMKMLGISEKDETHPIIGNVNTALENVIQQRYLHKGRVRGPDGATLIQYELAERALDLALNDKLKAYLTQMMNITKE